MTPPPAGTWRPSASPEALAARARLLATLREFFAQRGVMEVETPLLLPAPLPEPHIEPLTARIPFPGHPAPPRRFLPPSPEGAMKRLLAAGSGPIYQITRAFRADPPGRLHNPEFTLLEWYRPAWSMEALMEEVADLVTRALARPPSPPVHLTFRQAFQRFAGIDPFTTTAPLLEHHCRTLGITPPGGLQGEELLDLLLLERVEPGLAALGGLVFLTRFPASRAALARIDPGPPPVALRFELYVDGVELANGYQELTDPGEQEERFATVNAQRRAIGLAPLPLDRPFLEALAAGLPESAGVALGVDRLLLLVLGATRLEEVLAFPHGEG